MPSSAFSDVALSATVGFSWVFLCELLVTAIVAIFFLLYFSRLIGSIVSLCFRWYLWKNYHVYIEIQALQVSFLAGRVFFKNFRYIGANEVVSVFQGSLTWRYWLLNTRKAGILINGEESQKQSKNLSRFLLVADGIEWFIFNRTPAYETAWNMHEEFASKDQDHEKSTASDSSDSSEQKEGVSPQPGVSGSFSNETHSTVADDMKASLLFHFLPVDLEICKAAIVVGNKTTPTLLVAHTPKGNCVIDAFTSKSGLDLYNILLSFNVHNFNILLRANIDFEGPQDVVYQRPLPPRQSRLQRIYNAIGRIILSRITPAGKEDFVSKFTQKHRWKGLNLYLDDMDEEDEPLIDHFGEYAKNTKLVECPQAQITLYFDIPGKVPRNASPLTSADGPDIGNNGPPPAWGYDCRLRDATIHYGPWADRQKDKLFKAFFPQSFVDNRPFSRLSPGDNRVYTRMEIFIEFEGFTIIRIPTREPSNDAAAFEARKNDQNFGKRPFGWLEIKICSNSTTYASLSLVNTNRGYENIGRSELKQIEVRSSVNHDLLFTEEKLVLSSSLKYPLKWNGLQEWSTFFRMYRSRWFLLREHINLISDLMTDLSSGREAPYYTFVPSRIYVEVNMSDFIFYLNINDGNIIDNPSDLSDNIFLALGGSDIHFSYDLPLETVRARTQEVTIQARSQEIDVSLNAPPWHTMSSFLDSKELGKIYDFKVKGVHNKWAFVSPGNMDSIILDISASSLTLAVYGFLIRYVTVIRENYFGEHVHFQTLQEYAAGRNEADKSLFQEKNENDFDACISLHVDNGCFLFPSYIYSANKHIRLDFPTFDMDVRFTNYYMDFEIDFSPICGRLANRQGGEPIMYREPPIADGTENGYIDGIHVYAHRMFGLPPSEPTYLCNWEIDFGDVTIGSEVSFLQALTDSARSFSMNLNDVENALMIEPLPLNDVTLLQVSVRSLKIQVAPLDHNCLLELSTGKVLFTVNDLANIKYSSRIDLKIEEITLACTQSINGTRIIHGLLRTSLYLTNFTIKPHADKNMQAQQLHVAIHDAPFDRAVPFLDPRFRNIGKIPKVLQSVKPGIPLPDMPDPVVDRLFEKPDESISSPYMPSPASRRQSLISRMSLASSVNSYTSFDVDDKRSTEAERDIFENLKIISHDSRGTVNPGRRDAFCSAFIPPIGIRDDTPPDYTNSSEPYKTGENPSDSIYSDIYNLYPKIDYKVSTTYESYICEFDSGIEGYIDHETADCMACLVEQFSKRDSTSLFDSLEKTITFLLQSLLVKLDLTTYVRVVCPFISVKYITSPLEQFHTESYEEMLKLASFISVDVVNLSFISKSCKTRAELPPSFPEDQARFQRSYSPIHVETDLLVKADQVDLAVTCPISSDRPGYSGNVEPLYLRIESLECWSRGTRDAVSSLRTKLIEVTIGDDSFSWLIAFAFDQINQSKPLLDRIKKSVLRERESLKYLIYAVVTCGEACKIIQDPSALTKPTHIVRSSKKHIRATNSWRLMTRVRYVSQCIPREVAKDIEHDIETNQCQVPANVMELVGNLFHQWRSWESDDLGQSLLLRVIYNEESLKTNYHTVTSKYLFDSDSIALRFRVDDVQNDYISVEFLEATFYDGDSETSTDSELVPKRLKVVVYCGSLLSHFSRDILRVIDVLTRSSKERQSSSERDGSDDKEKPREKKPGVFSGTPDIQIFFVCEASVITIESASVALQVACHGLQMSSLASPYDEGKMENADSVLTSLLCETDAIEFDILSTKDKSSSSILTMGLRKTDAYVMKRPTSEVSTMDALTGLVFLNVDTMIVQTVMDAVKVSKVVCDFLTEDLEHIIEIVKRYSPVMNGKKLKEKKPLENEEFWKVVGNVSVVRLSFSLLPSVVYEATTNNNQFFLTPLSRVSQKWGFEINSQQHQILKSTISQREAISIMNFSKVSATAEVTKFDPLKTYINGSVVISAFMLDAGLFQSIKTSLLGELRSELSNAQTAVSEMKECWDRVRQDMRKQFKFSEVAASSGEPRILVLRLIYRLKQIRLRAYSQSKACFWLTVNDVYSIMTSNRMLGRDGEVGGPFSFGLEIPSLQISIDHPTILNGSERLLNFNLAIEGSFYDQGRDSKVKLSVKSNVLNITGSRTAVLRLAEIIQQFDDRTNLSTSTKQNEEVQLEPVEKGKSFKLLANTEIEVVVKQISFAWICEYSGDETTKLSCFVIGCEAATLSCRKARVFRTSIENFFFKVVGGDGSDSYLPLQSGAVMPKIDLCLVVEKDTNSDDKRLFLNVRGNEIQVVLSASFVKKFMAVVNSLNETMADYEAMFGIKGKPSPSHSEGGSGDKFLMAFQDAETLTMLRLDVSFQGSVMEFWDEPADHGITGLYEDEASGFDKATFQQRGILAATFRAPGIGLRAEYMKKVNSVRDLIVEMQLSPSDNTLYPKFIPVLTKAAVDIRDSVRQTATREQAAGKQHQQTPTAATGPNETAPSSIPNLLKKINLSAGFQIHRQQITLSCEPTAKVAAVAGFQSQISVVSCEDEVSGRTFATAAVVRDIEVSLQHVYSREFSGRVSIQDISSSIFYSHKGDMPNTLRVVPSISNISIDLNYRQLHDVKLFLDIWAPNEDLTSLVNAPTKKKPKSLETSLLESYRRVSSTSAFPLKFIFNVSNVSARVDLGQSLGEVKLQLEKLWLSSSKTTDWDHRIVMGLEAMSLSSKGRLAGLVKVTRIMIRISIGWGRQNRNKDYRSIEQDIVHPPAIHTGVIIEAFESKLSFDYDTFSLIDGEKLEIYVFNQPADSGDFYQDSLVGVVNMKAVTTCVTVLAPSTLLLILQTFQRLNQEQAGFYRAVLNESSKVSDGESEDKASGFVSVATTEEGAKELKLVRTALYVAMEHFDLNVFPTNLMEERLFKLRISGAEFEFQEEWHDRECHNGLKMKMTQLVAALSTNRAHMQAKTIDEIPTDEYIRLVRHAKGGSIVRIPQVDVLMDTWQIRDSKVVKFIFSSKLSGRVNVGWNLGSINFIRDMWRNMKHAFETRLRLSKVTPSRASAVAAVFAADEEADEQNEAEQPPPSSSSSLYQYIALSPPIIEHPQLRDMGEATPPMEWLGLNREKIPSFVHKLIILTLQEISSETEKTYRKLLDKA